jgi:DNA integrity scanning protein DisA with diadenylate cyclase activity
LRVYENRVLKRISGLKREEVARDWRRLHYEELHNLCTLQNIIRVLNSRRMRWAEYVARMGEITKCIKYFGCKT